MSRKHNTNAYLNVLNREHKKALSNTYIAANHAARKILNASGKVKNIKPTVYDPVAEKTARNALNKASAASWNTMVAAEKIFPKGNAVTKEKEAAQDTYQLQALMHEITTNMNRYMNPPHAHNKPSLRNTVYRKILLAKNKSNHVRKAWESFVSAGGRRTRRTRH